jgi:hypothetical protein
LSIIINIIIIIIISSSSSSSSTFPLVTGIFSLVLLLLNQRRSPLLRLQVSDCSTVRIMYNVPSTAVFCSKSIECYPGVDSKFFFNPSVTLPVAVIITGMNTNFMFHIRCISIHTRISVSFLLPFTSHFLPLVLSHLSVRIFIIINIIIIIIIIVIISRSQ